jgi:hypothetical protein
MVAGWHASRRPIPARENGPPESVRQDRTGSPRRSTGPASRTSDRSMHGHFTGGLTPPGRGQYVAPGRQRPLDRHPAAPPYGTLVPPSRSGRYGRRPQGSYCVTLGAPRIQIGRLPGQRSNTGHRCRCRGLAKWRIGRGPGADEPGSGDQTRSAKAWVDEPLPNSTLRKPAYVRRDLHASESPSFVASANAGSPSRPARR